MDICVLLGERLVAGRGRRGGYRRRNGTLLGAQVGDQLGDLGVRERVGEGRHLLAAVENLIGDFVRWPELVGAQTAEIGTLLSAAASRAVAVGASLVAEEDGAGLFCCFFLGTQERLSGDGSKRGQG